VPVLFLQQKISISYLISTLIWASSSC